MFEYHVERALQRDYDETTEWECSVDAVYTFVDNTTTTNTTNDDNNSLDQRQQLQQRTSSVVSCLFSRVYLNDMDLINMGIEEAGDGVGDGQATTTTTTVDGGDDHHNDNNDGSNNGGGGGDAVVGDDHDDDPEQHQQQKPLSTKKEKAVAVEATVPPGVRRQNALRRKLKSLMFSLTPDGETSMLEQCFGQLDDVRFESYQSAHKSKKKCIRYPKRAFPVDDSGGEDEWESAPETHCSSSSSSIEQAGVLDTKKCQQSLASLLNFDFGFCPTRDAALVAKNANKWFAKDKVMGKYWFQRNRFFSKLNEGILMDREGWFSVTPERVARHVADRVVLLRDCTVLDAFTGVGGNAIQFALRGAYVIAVDIDPVKLRCALQNARVYGVEKRICFICGSFFHIAAALLGAREAKKVAARQRRDDGDENDGRRGGSSTVVAEEKMGYPHGIDAVFLSPPWGGPAYLKSNRPFDLLTDMEPNGVRIFRVAQQISPNIVYYLPKNTRTDQLMSLAGPDGAVELEQTVLNEKIKALHAYYGILVAT